VRFQSEKCRCSDGNACACPARGHTQQRRLVCVCVCVYNIFNLYCHWCIANSCSRVRLFYGQKATGYARDPILLYYTVIITITIIIIIIIFGSESRNAFFCSRRPIIWYAYDTLYVLQCVCILLLLLLLLL
jgi:hypothetical protein